MLEINIIIMIIIHDDHKQFCTSSKPFIVFGFFQFRQFHRYVSFNFVKIATSNVLFAHVITPWHCNNLNLAYFPFCEIYFPMGPMFCLFMKTWQLYNCLLDILLTHKIYRHWNKPLIVIRQTLVSYNHNPLSEISK